MWAILYWRALTYVIFSFSSAIPIALRVKYLAMAKSSQSPAFLAEKLDRRGPVILHPPEVDVVDKPDPAVEEMIDFFKFFPVRCAFILTDHLFPFQQTRRRIFAVLGFRLLQEFPVDPEIFTNDRAGNRHRREKSHNQQKIFHLAAIPGGKLNRPAPKF